MWTLREEQEQEKQKEVKKKGRERQRKSEREERAKEREGEEPSVCKFKTSPRAPAKTPARFLVFPLVVHMQRLFQ